MTHPQQKTKTTISRLVQVQPFSKWQLMLLVGVVALAGIYVVWRTMASSVTIEAESLSLPSGGTVIADTTASNGQALRLNSVGAARGSFTLSSQTTTLAVRARGVLCKG